MPAVALSTVRVKVRGLLQRRLRRTQSSLKVYGCRRALAAWRGDRNIRQRAQLLGGPATVVGLNKHLPTRSGTVHEGKNLRQKVGANLQQSLAGKTHSTRSQCSRPTRNTCLNLSKRRNAFSPFRSMPRTRRKHGMNAVQENLKSANESCLYLRFGEHKHQRRSR